MNKTEGPNSNARFSFRQSSKKEEYFNKVFSNFKELCSRDRKPLIKNFTTNNTKLQSFNFQTLRLPCLNYYYNLFYIHFFFKYI